MDSNKLHYDVVAQYDENNMNSVKYQLMTTIDAKDQFGYSMGMMYPYTLYYKYPDEQEWGCYDFMLLVNGSNRFNPHDNTTLLDQSRVLNQKTYLREILLALKKELDMKRDNLMTMTNVDYELVLELDRPLNAINVWLDDYNTHASNVLVKVLPITLDVDEKYVFERDTTRLLHPSPQQKDTLGLELWGRFSYHSKFKADDGVNDVDYYAELFNFVVEDTNTHTYHFYHVFWEGGGTEEIDELLNDVNGEDDKWEQFCTYNTLVPQLMVEHASGHRCAVRACYPVNVEVAVIVQADDVGLGALPF